MNGLASFPVTVEPHAAGAQELAIHRCSVSWGLLFISAAMDSTDSTPRTACNATTGFRRGPCMLPGVMRRPVQNL
jgi:hypothetical protein